MSHTNKFDLIKWINENKATNEIKVIPAKRSWDMNKVFYSFKNLPDKSWTSDTNKTVPEEFFDGKDFEEYQFTNFVDMDKMFGHNNSLFGTRGLEVGNPNRTSRSFDQYNDKFGPALVRVIKENKATNEIKVIPGNRFSSIKQEVIKKLEAEYQKDPNYFDAGADEGEPYIDYMDIIDQLKLAQNIESLENIIFRNLDDGYDFLFPIYRELLLKQ